MPSAVRELHFRQDGKRHWCVCCSARSNAYVYQSGRFDGDIAFWQSGLSQADQVKPVNDETELRFNLSSEKDFAFFHEAVTAKLQSVQWSDGVTVGDDDVDEKEEG